MKKSLSVLLVLIIVCASLALSPISVSAYSSPNWYCGAYSSSNPYAWSNLYGQCTWYAWGRAMEITGVQLPCRGYAQDWVYQSGNYSVDMNPSANSVVVWRGGVSGCGHVAFVEEVNGNNIVISQSNGGSNYTLDNQYSLGAGIKYYNGFKTMSMNEVRSCSFGTLAGFIHCGSVAPTPSLTISSVSFPETVFKGETASPSGSLTSNGIITWVWAAVTIANGEVVNLNGDVKKAETNPMTYTYNFNSLTQKINLSNLPVGEYYYTIHAISNNTYYVPYRQKFVVAEKQLTISNVNFTDEVIQGFTASPSGTLTSNGVITWVWAAVTIANGEVVNLNGDVKKAETNPMIKTYDFSSLTQKIDLSNLPAGEYYYTIHAISNNTYYVPYRQKFVVAEKQLTISNVDFTDEVIQGCTASPSGTLTSNGVITWVWAAVTIENGDVVNLNGDIKKAEINPMTKTYDFSSLTQRLIFLICLQVNITTQFMLSATAHTMYLTVISLKL